MAEAGKQEEPEFKWGKMGAPGGKKKDSQFYFSFTYDGVEYNRYDSVYLYKEGEPEPYIGKLIKIWEAPGKSKKVKILWYFRPCEIDNFLDGTQTLDNELFLACGEGLGLTNINPLEAIAGKCNVVCISKDSRNPQPSHEDLEMAEFLFYRFFDVGQHKILDTIAVDKIGETEVENIFNKLDSQKPVGVAKLDLDKKEVSGTVTTINEVVALSSQKNSQPMIEKAKDKCFDTLARENDDPKPLLGEKTASSVSVKEASKSNDKTMPQAKDKENGASKASLVKQKSSTKLPSGSRGASEMGQIAETDGGQGNTSMDETLLRSKVDSEKGERKVIGRLVGQINKGLLKDKALEQEKRDVSCKKNNLQNRSIVSNGDDVEKIGGGVVRQINKGLAKGKALEQEKRDVPSKVSNEKLKNNLQNQRILSNDDEAKKIAPSSSKGKYNIQRAKDFCDVEEVPSKKLKLDKKPMKLSSDKLHEESLVSPDVEHKLDCRATEVTRRPDADRSKWFKRFPWEERMKTAYEQGTLVLLENLDPSLTSQEVEDIIWHAFKESCTAKVIQGTAFSSPHSGQAFVILKKKNAAELVIRKLEEGCLLMSNGLPLVGSFGCPCFPEKRPIFYGHLVVDQLRMQMQREMKDAVSTSHCSQSNNIEYDMAMEWCLLQERADKTWRRLFQQQGKELRKVKAKLNSK